jgi:Zn-dependent protease
VIDEGILTAKARKALCYLGGWKVGKLLGVKLLWPGTRSLNVSIPFAAISMVGMPLAQGMVVAIAFLKQLFFTSLILGCFNLIPVPPLDGSWIFAGFLPQGFQEFFARTRQLSSIIFLLLVVTPVFDYILSVPVSIAWGALQLLVGAMGLA